MVFHFWEFKEAKEFIVMWRVDQGQKWAAILKQKHFQIGWEGWNVEGYNGREKDKEMTEGKGDMNTLYHRQSIGCLLVANFLISHHFSLSLFHPPPLSAILPSFHYIAPGSEVDIWVLHRGTWTWATAGRTSHTSLTHTLFGQSHERELWIGLLGWQHTTQLG